MRAKYPNKSDLVFNNYIDYPGEDIESVTIYVDYKGFNGQSRRFATRYGTIEHFRNSKTFIIMCHEAYMDLCKQIEHHVNRALEVME